MCCRQSVKSLINETDVSLITVYRKCLIDFCEGLVRVKHFNWYFSTLNIKCTHKTTHHKICTDIQGAQRINPTDFVDPTHVSSNITIRDVTVLQSRPNLQHSPPPHPAATLSHVWCCGVVLIQSFWFLSKGVLSLTFVSRLYINKVTLWLYSTEGVVSVAAPVATFRDSTDCRSSMF